MTAKKAKSPRAWMLLALLLLIVAAGGGYAFWRQGQPGQTAPAQNSVETSPVRVGDLTLTASGSGTLVASQTVDVSFPTSGTVGTLNVTVGDAVTAGQVLAALAGLDELEQDAANKALALEEAQRALDDLTADPHAALAQAQLDLAEAQAALAQAQDGLLRKGDPRCPQDVTWRYYDASQDAQRVVDRWEAELNKDSQYGWMYIMENLEPARKQRNLAYWNYTYCQGYTDQEIEQSEANLAEAQANLQQAEANLRVLEANGGVDPQQTALAEAEVANAKAQLVLAQKVLDEATLVAPVNGTVTSLAAEAGDAVDTATFITLTDLAQPELAISLDETDLQNVAVGCEALITFDAVADRTFTGTVTALAPTLASSNGYTVLQGTVDITGDTSAAGRTLPLGLSAAVDVTCSQASGVLLAPVEALHQAEDGQYYVFVLSASGEQARRSVEVGLQTITFAEIRAGLEAGEQVVTVGASSR